MLAESIENINSVLREIKKKVDEQGLFDPEPDEVEYSDKDYREIGEVYLELLEEIESLASSVQDEARTLSEYNDGYDERPRG